MRQIIIRSDLYTLFLFSTFVQTGSLYLCDLIRRVQWVGEVKSHVKKQIAKHQKGFFDCFLACCFPKSNDFPVHFWNSSIKAYSSCAYFSRQVQFSHKLFFFWFSSIRVSKQTLEKTKHLFAFFVPVSIYFFLKNLKWWNFVFSIHLIFSSRSAFYWRNNAVFI